MSLEKPLVVPAETLSQAGVTMSTFVTAFTLKSLVRRYNSLDGSQCFTVQLTRASTCASKRGSRDCTFGNPCHRVEHFGIN